VLNDIDNIAGVIFKYCVADALDRLSGKLLAAVSQLNSADAQTQLMPETLEKLQGYHQEFEKYALKQLEAPIAVLQEKLAERQIQGAYDHNKQDPAALMRIGNVDDAQLRAGRAALGYSNKRQRTWSA
jgi:hypothetical protein